MKINSLIRYHVEKLKNLSLYGAKEYLARNQFHCIGSGCEAVVYSRKGFDYVIKLHYSPFSNSGVDKGIPSDKHFANQIAYKVSYGNIIIQEKCDSVVRINIKKHGINFKKFRRWVEEKYKVSDIHTDNVGIRNGKFVVFDWTLA